MTTGAMQEAIELATIVTNLNELPVHVVSAAITGALRDHPVRALAGQAALTCAIARMAEEGVAALLADPELLQVAWMRAEQGAPLSPAAVELSRDSLLRRAGSSAARLSGNV